MISAKATEKISVYWNYQVWDLAVGQQVDGGLAEYLLATGRNGAMQNAMETARALDPASVSVTNDPALIAYIASQYEAAEANARINASLNSQDLFAQHILTLSLDRKSVV